MKLKSFRALTITLLLSTGSVAGEACSDPVDSAPDGGAAPTSTVTDPRPSATATSTSTPPTDAAPPSDSAIEASATTCTAALEALMKPIDKVTTGAVTILDEGNPTTGRTVYVDATAGGAAQASTNPRTYVSLTTATRVDVTDKTAKTSADWDLALERAVLFTNGGHGGPGSGSAVYVPKPFADVGASDAIGKTFPEERFVDAACDPIVDQTNAVKTTFDGWYDYDLATSRVSPKSGTFLVKGAKGELFKVAVLQYYATPDGGSGISGANYVLRIGKL